jgi:predicted secreted protein
MLTALLVTLSLANAAPATRTVTSADAGKTITIVKHQKLQVELSECGSCGYRWKTTARPDPKLLTRGAPRTKEPTCPPSTYPSQPQCVGGSYTRVFPYTGKSLGRTKLRLEYLGRSSSDSSQAFQITIRVR